VSDVIVIDDLVTKTYQDQILARLTSYPFDWHWNPSNVLVDDGHENDPRLHLDANTIDSYQLTHLFLHEDRPELRDPHRDLLLPLLWTAKDRFGLAGEPIRCKANLQTNNRNFGVDNYNPAHTDSPDPHVVVVYYVNDSDGDTIIFNEQAVKGNFELTVKQRVTPKKGRAVMFDGKYLHSSCNPIGNDSRIIINMDFALPHNTKLVL
jgi:hypothetical protein